jgi:pyruvate,orthophosphate dikinase
VNVQAMVFGNMGEDCATGVCFTRDPSTGENIFYGEYLINAQGEDVVAGIRTPQPMSEARAKPGERSMETAMPAAYAELVQVRGRWSALPRHAGHRVHGAAEQALHAADAQRQAHRGRLLKIAVDMAARADRPTEAVSASPASLDQLLHPTLDPTRRASCSRRACPPRRARPAAWWCSPPTRRRRAPTRARR